MNETREKQEQENQAKKQSPNTTTKTIGEWAEMIKIEHTVFALPFAMSGLILACAHLPPAAASTLEPALPSWLTVFWTALAFLGARSAAMTFNRLIDSKIDALNPRTSMRSIPAGKITAAQALLFTVLSFALMLFAASHLPPLCLALSPIAVFWLSFYSYTKRFTWLCHLVLGIALGGGALGGWIAAGGQLNEVAPWVLALAVFSWVSGFDIIYACQDVDFDRTQKLHSIPARFGLNAALNFSTALHVITVCALIALGFVLNLGIIYWLGITVVASMLVYEHSLVSPQDLSKVNAAFFTVNGWVSILAFCAILADRLLHIYFS